MNNLQVVPQEKWLEARKELLVKEKELTRALDALRAERQVLPMVGVGILEQALAAKGLTFKR